MTRQATPPIALILLAVSALLTASAVAQQTPPPITPAQRGYIPDDVAVRAIEPPAQPLPAEANSARVTKFSFFAYGDTRSGGPPAAGQPAPDGTVLNTRHAAVVDAMLATAQKLEATDFPVRFVVSSGDAVLWGPNGTMWNVSYTPIIERLTRQAGLPFFFVPGNHDTGNHSVAAKASGDPNREQGLRNTLSAMSKLMPPNGSPRRLDGYPTFSFGYGNAFFIMQDSAIPTDATQFDWVTKQLEGLNRSRYKHVFAVFHHPPFDSGQHGGSLLEPQSAAIRAVYLPLFRKYHVKMTITGHDHLLDHWVERYKDGGKSYRMDHLLSGGGGAPTYVYTGEPDVSLYVKENAAQNVRLEHLMKPGPTVAANPNHFVVVRVNGDKLSLEVVPAVGVGSYLPYGKARIDLN